MTNDERFQRVAEIDRMFDEAKGWGSWMVSVSNERRILVNQLRNEGYVVEHKHQARTASGGRVS